MGQEGEEVVEATVGESVLETFLIIFFAQPLLFDFRFVDSCEALRSACPTLSLAFSDPIKHHLFVFGFNLTIPTPVGD